MEMSVLKLSVLSFLIISLSHIVQPRAWVDFFIYLRQKGVTGVFITAFIHLPFGVFVVAFHNVWTGIPAILTVMGWGLVCKGTLYFIFPRVGLLSLSHVSVERTRDFVIAGAVMLGLTIVLALPLFAFGSNP
jgi:hypothetical protein